MTADTKLTLGPLLFNWTAEQRRDFYARIADEAPVDTVYLGEVVCPKRLPFFQGDLPDIAERLSVSRSTARAHVSNILSKLGVSNRAEAIAFALRRNLVD